MAVHYLLDTNTASYIIKGNVPRVRERLIIAAQALSAEAVLVTNDRAFRRVKGLQIEDWSR